MYDQYGQKFYVKGVNYLSVLYVPSSSGTSGMYLARARDYYSTNTYTCTSSTGCLNDIAYDFNYIVNTLGCNTIRLFCGNIYLNKSTCDSATDYRVDVGDPSSNNYHSIYPSLDIRFMVPFYKQIIDLANGYGLNVILLLPGVGSSCTSNTAISNAYNTFLDSVGNGLKTCTNLIAYDEWNEPQYYEADHNFTKRDVCSMTHTWYSHLKTHDPNHLITIGLGEAGYSADAMQWDGDDYKADFYAFHVYPSLNLKTHQGILDQNLDYGNVSVYNDRYNSTLTWIQNTTSLPWLIGETGFRANPNPDTSSHYFDDGTLSQQSTYLTNAFTQTIKSGGMGTVWFQYSDVVWNPPADPSVNYFGLVDRVHQTIKTAGTTLYNFNSSSIHGAPAGYSSNYQNFLGYTGTVITGTVKDAATNQPIKDAVISGVHLQPNQFDPTQTDYLYSVQTLTDANGNFSLTSVTPPPPVFSQSLTVVNKLSVSAVGYDLAFHDGFTTNIPCSGRTFTLNKETNYDIQPSPAHYIATNNDPLISAPNTLTLSDFRVYFSGGGTVHEHDYTAQKEIQILPNGTVDSYVENTAEAAFYISEVDFNCSDITNSYGTSERKANTGTLPVSINGPSTGTESIVKILYLDAETISLKIYPNPAQEKVLVESDKSLNFVYIVNMYGQRVAEFNVQGGKRQEINIGDWAPGVYLFKITYGNGQISYSQIIKH